MGRSIISITAINRMISKCNSMKRANEREALINANRNLNKDGDMKYSLINVEFAAESRVAKLEFLRIQKYRTIERYVTQNYVKYPIYSDWKTRQKNIKKTVKLTNAILEELNCHEDDLIRIFAEDIILKINDHDLFPSWLLKKALKENCDDAVADLNNHYKTYVNTHKNMIDSLQGKNGEIYNQIKDVIREVDCVILKYEKRRVRIEKKLDCIRIGAHKVAKGIFTLGIYSLIMSESCAKRSYEKIMSRLNKANNDKKMLENLIKDIKSIVAQITTAINNKTNQVKAKIKAVKDSYVREYDKIKPLDVEIKKDSNFMPLKSLVGIEYEKIVGCYIIRNTEKDKYYVGQSKDVLKRLKQHFNGTVPKNQIFAEDYYLSKAEDKRMLFEYKIIPCSTKDELDSTEMKLISDYDSCQNGYNSTSGNT